MHNENIDLKGIEDWLEMDAFHSDANIVSPNVSASNGIIHMIDAVILPIIL